MEITKSLKDEEASRDACKFTSVGTLSVTGAGNCVDGNDAFGVGRSL